MSNSLPLVWLWDCRPLAADAWGNVQGFCDYVGTERRILIRRWVDCRPSVIANPPPLYRPAYAPLPPLFADGGARWCYVPTEADIARVRELLPDCLTPEHPAWYDVEARLVAAGHSPSDLAAMHPVALLTLLAAANLGGEAEAEDPGCLWIGRLYAGGIMDDQIAELQRIRKSPALTVSEKLCQIDRILPIPLTASARDIANALGVSASTVVSTAWWRRNRRGHKDAEIERRQERLTERGRRLD